MTEINITQDIHEAIKQATIEAKQDEVLATRIISWFDSILAGNESLEDHGAVGSRLDLILRSVKLNDGEAHNAE